MIDFMAFGLALDAIGAVVVLAPSLPSLMSRLDYIRPFSRIETAKEQLYLEGEIERSDVGFSHLASAVELAGPPIQSAETMEEGPETSIHVEIGGEEIHIEKEGYNLIAIEKADDAPLATAEFRFKYRPRAADESGIDLIRDSSPYLAMTKPPGEFPRLLQEHKERLTFRIGASLLFLGFVIQLAVRLL
ncbi:hypothetical protein HSRCO_1140 [Halanaeroarchaeum sp. HSR-CO]|uniref:hypothetical protein n=1 Tax=Halanaeroarchaeum sp. HSR-CO TaxID=2866382 RepID=UPI00217DCA84|nr:hypothetical protein [Halanaeroarchaeum sp. HSR-CO]UWG47427.1 hypothetical protein HSRCO_1140 [Halanaeroarchaeum sp. HSR-CO]